MPIETKSFRHSAGFGKHIKHWIVGRMLKDGLDVSCQPADGPSAAL
jgi:hypothetical protein